MADVTDTRVVNLSTLASQWGGASSLAKKLKLSGPSYICQLISGVRPITEKTARKFEHQLGLATGWMDMDHNATTKAAILDDRLITKAIALVGEAVNENQITLRPEQFGEIVSLVYGEAQRSGRMDEQLVQRIVRLLK
ncbi:MAG: hypothetical protein RIR91_340 [Verrucomicrobiota bacterium]